MGAFSQLQGAGWRINKDQMHHTYQQLVPGNVPKMRWGKADTGFMKCGQQKRGNRMHPTSRLKYKAGTQGKKYIYGTFKVPRDLGWGDRNWYALPMTFSPIVGLRSLAFGGFRLPQGSPNSPTGEAKASVGCVTRRSPLHSGKVGRLQRAGGSLQTARIGLGLGIGTEDRGHGYLGNWAQSKLFWSPQIWGFCSEVQGPGRADQLGFSQRWELESGLRSQTLTTLREMQLIPLTLKWVLHVHTWVRVFVGERNLSKKLHTYAHNKAFRTCWKVYKNKNHFKTHRPEIQSLNIFWWISFQTLPIYSTWGYK